MKPDRLCSIEGWEETIVRICERGGEFPYPRLLDGARVSWSTDPSEAIDNLVARGVIELNPAGDAYCFTEKWRLLQ
jgi:hypothetical protein